MNDNNEESIDGKMETTGRQDEEGNNNNEDVQNTQGEISKVRACSENVDSNAEVLTENEVNSRSEMKSETLAEKEFEPIYDED